MSSSSNLYAADDTDAHSFSDELSPADGYFNHGDVPRHLVQDPSIDYKPEPKTLIAPPQQSSTGGTSRSSLHSLLPRSPSAQHYASPQLQLNTSNSHVSFDSPSSIASSPTEDYTFNQRSPTGLFPQSSTTFIAAGSTRATLQHNTRGRKGFPCTSRAREYGGSN